MTTYQKFKKLKIDHSAIGLEQCSADATYFCTPKGARIIGSAGVDGIHYCFVRGQGEMVFAVSPMNTPGQNVFPIARTFEDLLRLLLACGSMDALEQVRQWDEEQFEEYVAENHPSAAAIAGFDVLRDKLGITPMAEPFKYLQRLQDSYNYGQLNFSKEYYEIFNAAPVDEMVDEWKVTIEGGFRPKRGKAGEEHRIDRQFTWGDEHWHVPAVYLCSRGLVIDFCVEVDIARLKTYFQKAKKIEEQDIQLTDEEKFELSQEYPLNIEFHPAVIVNGELLRSKHGSWQHWVPSDIIGDDSWEDREARFVLEHYDLDSAKAWVISRHTFPWKEHKHMEIQSLNLQLERRKVKIPAARFQTSRVGDSVKFTHPITGVEHTLTVREYEAQEVDGSRFRSEDLEFPTHFTAMAYTIHPDLPDDAFALKDCSNGDNPRPKNPDVRGVFGMLVGAIAMIRSKDGPSQVFYVGDDPVKSHVVCSSMHFEPLTKPVEWHMIIREKMLPDMDVALI